MKKKKGSVSIKALVVLSFFSPSSHWFQ